MKNLLFQDLKIGDLVIELDSYNNHCILAYIIGFTKKRVRIKTNYYTSKGRLVNPKFLLKPPKEDINNYIKISDARYNYQYNYAQKTFEEYKEFKKQLENG